MSGALVRRVKHAYEGAADAWAEGPALVYRPMAEALVAASPASLRGSLVLDVGTGTGVAASVLAAVGARPVGVDLAEAMIRHRRAERPPAVVGDALALPFRTDAFDAAVSAFSLNHLPDPRAGLAECRRVTRPGGTLLAATFPADGGHPAKAAVEAVLAGFGYRRPRWYVDFQERTAALTAQPGLLATTASDAGLDEVEVRRIEVGAGLDDPGRVVGWRLDMPHTVGFVASLEPDVRARLRDSAAAALPSPLPVAVSVLVLLARVR